MPTKATIRQARYDEKSCRKYNLKLVYNTDSDIIDKLASVPSMQGYIKQLIRDDISGQKTAKQMSLEQIIAFLKTQTGDYSGSLYELLNAITQKYLNG